MKKSSYKYLIGIILVLSLLIRIFVIENNILNDNTQYDSQMGYPKKISDYDKLYDIDSYEIHGHLYYIMYLYNNYKLCDDTEGQTYHPPIHYIISSIWLHILDIFPLNSMQKIEGLQYLGLIYFLIAFVLQNKILSKMELSEISKLIIILLTNAHPKFIEMSASITNDMLTYVFILASILMLFKWNENPSFKNTFFIAITIGFGCLVKSNCIIMLFPAMLCYLKKVYNNIRNNEELAKILLEGIIFFTIFAFISLSYYFRCILLFGTYKAPIPRENLFIGNASIFEKYGINLKDYFLIKNNTKNLLNAFLLQSIYNLMNDKVFSGILVIINIVLIIVSLYGIKSIIKEKNEKSIILLYTYIGAILAYIIFNIALPYYCTMNPRYALISIFIGIILLGYTFENVKTKYMKLGIAILSVLFCILSVLGYLI